MSRFSVARQVAAMLMDAARVGPERGLCPDDLELIEAGASVGAAPIHVRDALADYLSEAPWRPTSERVLEAGRVALRGENPEPVNPLMDDVIDGDRLDDCDAVTANDLPCPRCNGAGFHYHHASDGDTDCELCRGTGGYGATWIARNR